MSIFLFFFSVKERKILSILEEIKTQVYVNSKLLHLLSKKVDVNISTEDNQLPQQMKFPLESEADMEKMEELLLDKDVYAKLVSKEVLKKSSKIIFKLEAIVVGEGVVNHSLEQIVNINYAHFYLF